MEPNLFTEKTIDSESLRNQPSLKNRDIVIIGLQPWYFPTGCNAKNIATEFSKNNRVLYVNFPLKRKLYYAKTPDSKIENHINIIKSGDENIRELQPNLWEFYPTSLIESVNWLPSTWLFKKINSINNRRLAEEISKAIQKLNFKDIILFNDNDIYNGYYLKEYLSPAIYIYYLRDFLTAYDYWKKHTSILEPELIQKSDIVLTNSEYYAEYSSNFNSNSYYVGQGCSFEYFDHSKSYSIPDDISSINRPIIGYIGALDSARLDVDIIMTIANANINWTVVLVGPEDNVFLQSKLHNTPNIIFLGGKPFHQLPAYVNAFDVCINPQYNNQITKGNYPLKIDEYLAMGKPVVATRTRAMDIFEDYTYLADQPDGYPALIEQAILENNPEKKAERIAFAQTHTWKNCMHKIYKAIESYKRK